MLAIDQTADENEFTNEVGNGKAKAATVGTTATLELDPSQVEILTAGEKTGTLSLALRSPADNCEERPPLTSLERSELWTHRTFGTIRYVQLDVQFNKQVQKTPGPACAPEQPEQVVSGDLQQPQQNSTGVALR